MQISNYVVQCTKIVEITIINTLVTQFVLSFSSINLINIAFFWNDVSKDYNFHSLFSFTKYPILRNYL